MTLERVTDVELMSRLPGDPDAFEELFRRHRRTVLAYAVRRCAQPADVADLVAATFMAVLETAGGFDPAKGAVRSWLIGVAHRQLGLLIRREHRERSLRSAAAGQRVLGEDAIARIEDRIDAARASVEMEHALAGLSSRHCEVLWLVGYEKLSTIDAAQVLGISPALFRVRLARARRALRAALQDPLPSHSPPSFQEVRG